MPLVSLETLIENAIAGQVVSFPTDTVPALATLPAQASLIFTTKQRPADKPLILMGATPADLWDYVQGSPQERAIWQEMAQQYFPGAITLVLPASDRVPAVMNPLDKTTIGIRVPAHATIRQMLAQTGCLATTSANRSGESPLEKMAEIASVFPSVSVLDVTALPVNEQTGSGLPSTVIKWNSDHWLILRQGQLKIKH